MTSAGPRTAQAVAAQAGQVSMVQEGPHSALSTGRPTQLTHNLGTGREIWEEGERRERERNYAVACEPGISGMGDRIRQWKLTDRIRGSAGPGSSPVSGLSDKLGASPGFNQLGRTLQNTNGPN